MKRIAVVVGVALALALGGRAEAQVFVGVSAQAVTATSATVDLGASGVRSVSIRNTGSNTIYGQAYYVGQTPAAATTSSPLAIAAGETYDIGTAGKFDEAPIRYLTLICAAGQTSTAKILGK